jgi:hypothetical protein
LAGCGQPQSGDWKQPAVSIAGFAEKMSLSPGKDGRIIRRFPERGCVPRKRNQLQKLRKDWPRLFAIRTVLAGLLRLVFDTAALRWRKRSRTFSADNFPGCFTFRAWAGHR